MVLVVIEAVPRTTVTEIVAVLIAVYLVGGRRHKLIWGPINPAAGAFGIFNLHLESSGDDAVPVEFGPISAANVQHAGQAGSAALADLGVPAEAPLKIRYAGAMDQKIVARIKRRP